MLPTNFDFTNTPASMRRPRSTFAPDGNEKPWVSVITRFFNAGEELHETARTVLRQTLQQWEWVIVNDGSTSYESLGVLSEYRHCDPRIHVIDMAVYRGDGAARNIGVAASSAPCVLHLDSQHLLEPTAVEKWAWFLDAHPGIAFVTADTVEYGEQPRSRSNRAHDARVPPEPLRAARSVMLRRSMHDAVGGYDESADTALESSAFWLRCANAGFRGATVAEYLTWTRCRANQPDRGQDARDREGPGGRPGIPPLEIPAFDARVFPDHSVEDAAESLGMRNDWPFDNRLKRSRRNILLVVPWMALGGADRFNLDLIEQMRCRGCDVTVVTTRSDEDQWAFEYQSRTPDVFALHRFLPLGDFPRFIAYLVQSRQSEAVIVSHSEFGYRLLPYLRSLYPEVALLDYLHVIEPAWHQGGYPRFSTDYRAHLDLTVTSSEHVREWISNRGVSANRTAVCYTAVDVDRHTTNPGVRRETRTRLAVRDEHVVILFVGRLCEQKDPAMLVAALARVLRMSANAEAWIVGDGPDRRAVEADVASRQLGARVRVLGSLPPGEIGRLMTAADVFFLPSRYEGISLALYEAMASGLPSVASDVGGHRELVTAEAGVLVHPSSFEEDLERYVTALHGLTTDPDLRQRMGDAARARVMADFSLTNMGCQMERLVEEAIRRRRAEPRHAVPHDVAFQYARTAVELTQLANRSASLWISGRGQGMREWLYIGLQRLLSPAYDWVNARGWRWVPSVGGRIRRFLLR